MDPAEAVLQEKALKFMVRRNVQAGERWRRWRWRRRSGSGLGRHPAGGGGSGTLGRGRGRGRGRLKGRDGSSWEVGGVAERTRGWGQQLRHLVDERPSDSGSLIGEGALGGAQGPGGKGA
ncbi:hypothetical protein J1605_021955 [Eschrichtius robustus]|uniref:Uncharacterized protein n=1 Tax=Eschrichtius robustus TaxID=9764 RepID=A0AB34HBM3_ESCRO|nr:hypothetical protein J1605_021955 [Eschrichtius robustus]